MKNLANTTLNGLKTAILFVLVPATLLLGGCDGGGTQSTQADPSDTATLVAKGFVEESIRLGQNGNDYTREVFAHYSDHWLDPNVDDKTEWHLPNSMVTYFLNVRSSTQSDAWGVGQAQVSGQLAETTFRLGKYSCTLYLTDIPNTGWRVTSSTCDGRRSHIVTQ